MLTIINNQIWSRICLTRQTDIQMIIRVLHNNNNTMSKHKDRTHCTAHFYSLTFANMLNKATKVPLRASGTMISHPNRPDANCNALFYVTPKLCLLSTLNQSTSQQLIEAEKCTMSVSFTSRYKKRLMDPNLLQKHLWCEILSWLRK